MITDTFGKLSKGLIIRILSSIELSDILNVLQTCKYLANYSKNNNLWKRVAQYIYTNVTAKSFKKGLAELMPMIANNLANIKEYNNARLNQYTGIDITNLCETIPFDKTIWNHDNNYQWLIKCLINKINARYHHVFDVECKKLVNIPSRKYRYSSYKSFGPNGNDISCNSNDNLPICGYVIINSTIIIGDFIRVYNNKSKCSLRKHGKIIQIIYVSNRLELYIGDFSKNIIKMEYYLSTVITILWRLVHSMGIPELKMVSV